MQAVETEASERKPDWLRVKIPSGRNFSKVEETLRFQKLHTVCEEAKCMNRAECWGNGTATFLVLGDVCTRNCRFCAAESAKQGKPLDAGEPGKIAEAAKKLGLNYVVLTSVDRDDLHDLGAGHFAECIAEIKKTDSKIKVEVLIPDFQGSESALRKVIAAAPDVVAHNIEVVERLQRLARDARASYAQSLAVLENAKRINPKILTKSSIMLGLGESENEVLKTMGDLRAAGCDFLTIGQYLQPSKRQLPVHEFVKPEKFAELEKAAYSRGFRFVASGPLVRSSYRAGEFFSQI